MAGIEYKRGRTFMGRIPYGEDVLDSLTGFVREKGIKKGRLQMIGAVQRAVVGFYDSRSGKYVDIVYDKSMEVLSLTGNISVKDGEPFVHAHVTLGDEQGRSFGGHLMGGTVVFAAEFIIEEFQGEDLERKHDQTTGLALWDI